jgi:hypothetical protein
VTTLPSDALQSNCLTVAVFLLLTLQQISVAIHSPAIRQAIAGSSESAFKKKYPLGSRNERTIFLRRQQTTPLIGEVLLMNTVSPYVLVRNEWLLTSVTLRTERMAGVRRHLSDIAVDGVQRRTRRFVSPFKTHFGHDVTAAEVVTRRVKKFGA